MSTLVPAVVSCSTPPENPSSTASAYPQSKNSPSSINQAQHDSSSPRERNRLVQQQSTDRSPRRTKMSSLSPSPTRSNKTSRFDPFTQQETVKVRSRRKSLSSSRYDISTAVEDFYDLPQFKDTAPDRHQHLFIRKLKQCRIVFDFSDPTSNVTNKEIKRASLMELTDYVSSHPECLLPSNVYREIVLMFSANAFRVFSPSTTSVSSTLSVVDWRTVRRTLTPEENARLPPPNADFEQTDEEDSVFEATWPHLQHVYELFLRILESDGFQTNEAKKCIDHKFISQLLSLFDSEDYREREYLKIILHRIYGKFLGARSHIRRSMNNVFLRCAYEHDKFNGISQLLEVYGSIINGFAVPLKEEHRLFLIRVLLPMHKCHSLPKYIVQMNHCLGQFIERESALVPVIFKSILKFWPKTCTRKEVLMISETEDIVARLTFDQYLSIRKPYLKQLSKCIESDHFQVAERSLLFFDDEYRANLVEHDAETAIPLLYPSIIRCIQKFEWNVNVLRTAQQVREMMEGLNERLCRRALS